MRNGEALEFLKPHALLSERFARLDIVATQYKRCVRRLGLVQMGE